MNNRTDVLGYVFTSLTLLGIGLAIHFAELWSLFGNLTLPWLCSTLALSLMVVCMVGLLAGRSPSEAPKAAVAMVYLATVLIVGIGIAVDAWESWDTRAFVISMAEWLGFAVILLILLTVPRFVKDRQAPDDASRQP